MDTTWETIVIGAGAAGLSAALVLGRARRRTLVVDAGQQSNRPAEAIGGLLGHAGRSPEALYALGAAELAHHPAVELRAGAVVTAERDDAGFTVTLADGAREHARTLLLATGMEYRPPELDGLAERWGRSVFHCPFCHGWEHRDRPLGVLDRGDSGLHRALLLSRWSDDVTLLAGGPAGLDEAQALCLDEAGIEVDERPVAGLRGPGTELEAVRFADGGERDCGGLLVPVTLHGRSALVAQLGAALAEPGPLTAEAPAVDPMWRTSVPGLYAVGDLAMAMPSVANAIASGSNAAAAIVGDRVMRATVPRERRPAGAAAPPAPR